MKKFLAAILTVAAVCLLGSANAQTTTDATLASKTYKFQHLLGIQASSVFEIQAVKGRSGKITIQAPEKTLEHIVVSEKGGVLILRVENGYNISNKKEGWFSRTKSLEGPVKVLAELPSVSELNLSGAATFFTKDNFSEKSCNIDLSGASKARFAKLRADYLDIDLSGASQLVVTGSSDKVKVDLSGAAKLFLNSNISEKLAADLSGASLLAITGKTDHTDLDCSGASHLEGKDFQTKELSVDLSGATKVQITALKKISGDVSGAASLIYYGDPDKVLLQKSRGASVSHK